VRTLTLSPVSRHQESLRYTGNIVAKRSSELGFERSGQLITLNVQEGQWVSQGTVIATLDTRNLQAQKQELLAQRSQATAKLQELKAGSRSETIAAAEAKVRDLKEQLALSQSKYQRRLELYQEGAISREDLEQVNTDANAQKARVDEAQSQVDELRAGTRPELISLQKSVIDQYDAQIASINLDIAKSTLKTPYSGTIALRHANIGTVVSQSSPIVRLVESNNLEARVGVPVDQVDQIPMGSQQRLKIGEETVTGKVTATLPQLDASTRTVTVILSLNQTQGLIPGQVVSLELSQSVPLSGFWLPTEALVQGTRGLWSAYVLGEPNSQNPRQFTVKRKDVEILSIEGDRLLVRGTLTSGDEVIVEGVHRIVPGQMVEVW
jgi:multidrug efflux pump subunit AcrA (membrane-fusion protein)